MNLESYNFHWRDGHSYGYSMRRDAYALLAESLKSRWITILTGTRRTGKTTMMKQLIDMLVEDGTQRDHIVYYSFDEAQPELRELVGEYERRLGRELAFSDERVYFFLDEVQKLDDWQNKVKYFYDQYRNIKFVLTGSASLFIRGGIRESLAGRVSEFTLGPLGFGEYLLFTGREEIRRNPGMWGETLGSLFMQYLPRHYIEIAEAGESEISGYVRSIAEKVIHVDIPALFPVEEPHVLMRLFRMICEEPGMIINYSTLADSLGSDSPVSRQRVSSYLHHLADAYLVTIGYNYSGSGVVSERKMKKAYPANPSFCLMVDRPPEMSKLVENAFFLWLGSRFFWRNPAKNEVDIVLETADGILPVEVKFWKQVTYRDMRGMLSFMRSHRVSRGVVVTRDTEDELHLDEGVISLIPAWKASLEGLQPGKRK